MASGQTQVLRKLGMGWMQCQDSQGVFYFNEQTRQSSDVVPPELGGPQQPQAQQLQAQQMFGQQQAQQLQAQQLQAQQLQAQQLQAQQAQLQAQQVQQGQQGQAKVKLEVGIWQVCEDAQGEFYYNSQTGQSFDEPPRELVLLYKATQAGQQQPQQPQQQQQQQQQQQPQQVQQAPAKVKLEVGPWRICEDAQGEFYQNSQTGQSFDKPPEELLQLYKASQSQQQVQQPQPQYAQQAPQGAPQGETKVKMQLGAWMVCEDAQGEFYFNQQTRESFEQPPPELVQLYKASQPPAGQQAPASYTPQAVHQAPPQAVNYAQYAQYGQQR